MSRWTTGFQNNYHPVHVKKTRQLLTKEVTVGDIGETIRHIELEPLEVPMTVPQTAPVPEKVPA